ncbi:MAG: sugar ABC transporter permease [Cereibacter sphaeroides]|uniref:Sugar ABC transporter permease n=1 Tax=Cereibacter sphaeroides TaxID=1063 RepID=A0A2W5S761_CERSP|nr:MAG: sugar ABC transporter permease [Cereibacter sphaeroides]
MSAAPAYKRGLSVGRIGLYAFLISTVLFFSIPLLIVISTSFKTMDEIRQGSIFSLPQALNFAPWVKAWAHACTGLECDGIRGGFLNSVKILIPSMILSIVFGAMNGYALAQWKFRGADALMAAIMIGAFIPFQVILYPLVKILASVGLYGNLAGIVLVHVVFGLPLMTMIFRNFYASMPQELIRAARIDGAGFFRIFFQIMLPMSINVLIVAVILQFTGIWNDYLLGMIFAGPQNLPMTVQLNNIVGVTKGTIEYNVNMAATLLTALPPLLVYLISGRYFVRGVASGAVKG